MGVLKTGATALIGDRQASRERKHVRRGTRRAADAVEAGFDDASAYLDPYSEAGVNALNQLQDPIANFYASPDYEFRRSEGLRDVGNLFAAKGGGGNAMKALTRYSGDLASGEFGNWFGRTFMQSEAGRDTANALAALRTGKATDLANIYTGKGRTLAGITRNKYTNINNAFQSGHEVAANLVGQYLGFMGGGGG